MELVFDALAATQAHDTCSLDTPRHAEDGSGESYADTLGEEDERLELVECDVTLRSGLAEAGAARPPDPPDRGTSKNSPRPRSPGGSASPRCRCRDCCAGCSTAYAGLQNRLPR